MFVYISNIFICDYGIDNVVDLVKVMEIGLLLGLDYCNRVLKMSLFLVVLDDNVFVIVMLVFYYDVYLVFGFCFDLKKLGVFVIFLGDIIKFDNLIIFV